MIPTDVQCSHVGGSRSGRAPSRHRWTRAGTWLLGLLLLGCSREDPIREYVVARPPVQGSLWFFKLLGPEAAVADAAGPLQSFVESVSFDEQTGAPRWTLPEGWTEEVGKDSVRYKTLRIPGSAPLEVAVTQVSGRVPPTAADLQTQAELLSEQVGASAKSSRDAPGNAAHGTGSAHVTPFAAGPYQGRLFDFSGQTPRFGKSRVIAAMVPVPISPKSASAAPASSGALPFTYTRPNEWRDAPPTQFSVVSLAAGEGEQTVAITITPAIGGLSANVNRWRGQAGLPPLDEDQLEDHLETIDAGGTTLLAAEAIGASRGILGGVLKTGQDLWFIKADGPPAAVQQERGRFRAFLESIRVE